LYHNAIKPSGIPPPPTDNWNCTICVVGAVNNTGGHTPVTFTEYVAVGHVYVIGPHACWLFTQPGSPNQ